MFIHVQCSNLHDLKALKKTSAACLPWDLSWPLAEIWLHAVYSLNLIVPPQATKQKPLKFRIVSELALLQSIDHD